MPSCLKHNHIIPRASTSTGSQQKDTRGCCPSLALCSPRTRYKTREHNCITTLWDLNPWTAEQKDCTESKHKAALLSSEANLQWNFLLHKDLGGEQGKPVTPARAGKPVPAERQKTHNWLLKGTGQKCKFWIRMAHQNQQYQNPWINH